MKIPIVDENNNIIYYKERSETEKGEICRAAGVWITDDEGNILLSQRSLSKTYSPGEWGPAAGGVVEEGETYESCVIRETEEEIGLKNIKPKPGFNKKYDDCFSQFYFLVLPKGFNDFKIQEEEVFQVKWFSRDELLKNINENPGIFFNGIKDLI